MGILKQCAVSFLLSGVSQPVCQCTQTIRAFTNEIIMSGENYCIIHTKHGAIFSVKLHTY